MRILLDTNVVSEARKPNANPLVVRRLNEPGDELFISVVTIGEIIKGISLLPMGAKRRELRAWVTYLERTYSRGMLDFDLDTSRLWGELTAAHELKGRQLFAADGQIAATALRHGLHLMTRNIKDFSATGLMLINPWDE